MPSSSLALPTGAGTVTANRASVERECAQAIADYEASVGCVVAVNRLRVAIGRQVQYLRLQRPAVVRVTYTPRTLVLNHSCKDTITPLWNVELVEQHAEVPECTGLAVHPRSYGFDGHLHQGDILTTSRKATGAAMLLRQITALFSRVVQ